MFPAIKALLTVYMVKRSEAKKVFPAAEAVLVSIEAPSVFPAIRARWAAFEAKRAEKFAAKDAFIAAKAIEMEAEREAQAAFDVQVQGARQAILSGEATLSDLGLILLDDQSKRAKKK